MVPADSVASETTLWKRGFFSLVALVICCRPELCVGLLDCWTVGLRDRYSPTDQETKKPCIYIWSVSQPLARAYGHEHFGFRLRQRRHQAHPELLTIRYVVPVYGLERPLNRG